VILHQLSARLGLRQGQVRTALQDAASVAGLLITTEAMVAELPKPPPPPLPGHGHGPHHDDMEF
jgi:chaperonin GroEL